jgi:hypothetical protein
MLPQFLEKDGLPLRVQKQLDWLLTPLVIVDCALQPGINTQ